MRVEQRSSPLVVGGTGGSGTRVITRILMYSGRYMGARRNEQDDAVEVLNFDYRWTPPYLAAREKGEELPEEERRRMTAEFVAACDRHRAPMEDPDAPWGWKHPPSIHLLPFLERVYPALRFIHVVRDPREASFRKTGAHVHASILADAVLGSDPEFLANRELNREGRTKVSPALKALFWARVNSQGADYGEKHMGDRYMRVRLEDLCAQPDPVLRAVFAFTGAPDADPAGIRDEIGTPSSGNWHDRDPAEIEAVRAAAGTALERFGYG